MGTVSKEISQPATQDFLESIHQMLSDHPTIWVFGYGSLLWKPDFQYKSKHVGYIKDYERRFYQGNVTFRGKPGQPGRVANLVESPGSQTWGVAYEVTGSENVTRTLQALHNRETTCGGYISTVTTFYPRELNDIGKDNKNLSDKACSESTDQYGDNSFHLQHSEKSTIHHEMHGTNSNLSESNTDCVKESLNNTDLKREGKENSDQSEGNVNNVINKIYCNNVNSTDIAEVYTSENESMQQTDESSSVYNGESHSLHRSPNVDSDQTESHQDSGRLNTALSPIQVLLFTATPDNDLYLGPDSISNMAKHVVNASGTAGSNVEYVTKIADYVRTYIPEDTDSHLFQLDAKIREEVYKKYGASSKRLQLGLSDFSRDMHSYELMTESISVMAS